MIRGKISSLLFFAVALSFSCNAMEFSVEQESRKNQRVFIEFNLEDPQNPTLRQIPVQEIVDYLTLKIIPANERTPDQERALQEKSQVLLETYSQEYYALFQDVSDGGMAKYALTRLLEAAKKGVEGTAILCVIGGKLVLVTTYHVFQSSCSFIVQHIKSYFSTNNEDEWIEEPQDVSA